MTENRDKFRTFLPESSTFKDHIDDKVVLQDYDDKADSFDAALNDTEV